MDRIKRILTIAAAAIIAPGFFHMNALAQAKGMDVTEVHIAAVSGGMPETIYRQSSGKTWSVIQDSKVVRTCSETNRDEWSVYLACPEGAKATLDLFKKEASMTDAAGATVKYPIASSSNAPVGAPTPAPVATAVTRGATNAHFTASNGVVINGRNVTYVAYSPNSSFAKSNFRDESSTAWSNKLPSGTTSCSEIRNDEWSVYLSCDSGRYQATLNLLHKTITLNSGGPPIPITDAKDQLAEARILGDETKVEYRPVLSKEDTEKVMMWIARELAIKHTPYCYKRHFDNAASSPMICKSGYNEDTLGLCYKKCAADERGIATFCYKNCPAGFRDDGLYCGKPPSYTRGAGYVIWDRPICEKENPQGCEQGGAIWYPKCRPNFHGVVTDCSPDCPKGWEDIGVSCKKPDYARPVIPVSECSPDKERAGLLCYPRCGAGFNAVGPVCWQNCSSTRLKRECGVGCVDDSNSGSQTCFQVTSNMVLAPILFLENVATLGLEGLALKTTQAATAQITERARNLRTVFENLSQKDATAIAEKAVKLEQLGPELYKVSNAFEKLEVVMQIKDIVDPIQSNARQEVDDALNAYADNYEASFLRNTSGEIDKKINDVFGGGFGAQGLGAKVIKRDWAKYQLLSVLESEKWNVAKAILNNASSAFDFLGIKSLTEAFVHPDCESANSNPFPSDIKLLYK
jgi:hypothetical protein